MTSNSSQPSLRPKPLDALVAAVIIALAVVTALLFYLPKAQGGQRTVVITQRGQEVCRQDINIPGFDKERVVELDDGVYHLTVRINDGGVYVSDSDCPGQDCVHTGVIRQAGQSIVCLPAQVVISIVSTSSAVDAVLG